MMKKIVQLSQYDLVLTYSWSSANHGICGHTYEVIEYFWLLKDHFNVGIMFCEDIDWETFESAIRDKYDFSDDEIQIYKDNTLFYNRPRLVKGNNILFTDGGTRSIKLNTLLFDNILMFACGDKEVKEITQDNVYVLQDDRVYDPVKGNGINYKKKLLFSRFKDITEADDNILLYGTKNCRDIDNDMYQGLLSKYDEDFIVLSNEENTRSDLDERFKFLEMPVTNLFSKFNTYVYTPVPRKFDCSPRFIAECKYYNKEVIYEINYLEEDKGLYYRKQDIENDFDSISLKEDDEIVDIIRNTCGL